jgi:tetratricopeptide (TPR) repeat protein
MKTLTLVFILASFVVSCRQAGEASTTTNATDEQLQSINELKLKLQQNPDSASARMKLVNVLDSLGMYKEALAQTDSLIKRDSLNNGLWFAKAQLLESNKDTAEAIRSYERAIRIYPSVEAQLNLANLFAETKNSKALSICKRVRRIIPARETDASCDFIEGVFYARRGNQQQAITLFNKAIANNYTMMEAYMEKGFIYYESKNYNDALKVFETAITVNNMYADAHYWKAKCYEAIGNKKEAIANYKRALGLDKRLREAAEGIMRLKS